MKNASVNRFLAAIDERCEAERSVVVRYRNVPSFDLDDAGQERFRQLLVDLSQREGLRITSGIEHAGVAVDVLDESTLMQTGTLKSIDGCVTTAHCLFAGHSRTAFATGGNTGTALASYGTRAGLETHCFVPTANLHLLDGGVFDGVRSRLVAVDDPTRVKPTAAAFCEEQGAKLVPEPAWRNRASAFIGWFLLEQLLGGRRYDWIVQAISAAFGPIGIYGVLRPHARAIGGLPRFLGIQQAGNSPLYDAWCARRGIGEVLRSPDAELLNPVMYDRRPQSYGTREALERLLEETNGQLDIVDRAGFDVWMSRELDGAPLLTRLARMGIPIAVRGGEVIEKAGLTALVGALSWIGRGLIAPGSRVLVCLTGGTYAPAARAVPHERITGDVVGQRPERRTA